MYGGGPGKVGRGGRGGGVRRPKSSFHSPTVMSKRGPAQTGRNSLGVGAAAPPRRPPPASSKASQDVEQTFSLVPRNSPLSFAAIIRLAPNLIDEIKRVEAQGGSARIKFDAVANNPDGNVIEVADKNFKFTWSDDKTALCDIYEERQSGKDGNGLLVESACVQRNVNVQRILDESTKKHVKMRSEEAEKKLKSRKAIVLDSANPSTKNQMKAIAAVDANPWKSGFRQKKEPPLKKRKSEPLQAPTKTVHKTGPVAAAVNGKSYASPLPSPPEQLGALSSPLRGENVGKGHIAMDTSVQELCKGSTMNLKKDIPNKTSVSAKPGKMGHKGKLGASSATLADLQSLLFALLMQNPKGMSLKALGKAIQDMIPTPVKNIEPIIKKIATFKAPGGYFLKQDLNLESFKKPLLFTESCPEIKQQTPSMELVPYTNDNHNQGAVTEQNFSTKDSTIELVEEAVLETTKHTDLAVSPVELIDPQQHFADLFGEKKMSGNNSEGGQTGSSSDGGSHSDSESESTDSDTDSDTPNSKQGSDEDVDIMTSDDDKKIKNPKMQTDDPAGSSFMSIPPINLDCVQPVDTGQKIQTPLVTDPNPINDGEWKTRSPCLDKVEGFNEMEGSNKARLKHGQWDNMDRTHRSKHWKVSDVKHLDERSECAKRQKRGGLVQPPICGGQFIDAPNDSSLVLNNRAPYESVPDQMNTNGGHETFGFGSEKNYNKNHGRSTQDFRPPIQKSVDHSVLHANESFPQISENGDDKKLLPILKDGGIGDINLQSSESAVIRKRELCGRFKETRQGLSPRVGNRTDAPNLCNDREIILQRELSDLELGELREPLPEEMPRSEKQFEGKTSSKESENRSDNWNSEFDKRKPVGKTSLDLTNMASPNMGSGDLTNMETFDKFPSNHGVEELTRTQHRVGQTQTQNSSAGPKVNSSAVDSGIPRQIESRKCEEIGLQEHKKTPKKSGNRFPQQNGTGRMASLPSNENLSKKTNIFADLNESQKDSNSMEINTDGHKRKESSSDERSCPYSKYEKEDPELKEPIKDFSQYMEYLKEYQEKYESYYSLNRILENYRNEFSKIGKDLEASKVHDMDRYYKILALLNDSYRQCGTKHKRLKKIFVVLHQELENLKQRIKDFAVAYSKD